MPGVSRVVIVGAGAVSTTCAYTLQISGTARQIVMTDLDTKHRNRRNTKGVRR